MKRETIFNQRNGVYALLAGCAGLWAFQFICLLQNAVNIPFWDEWEAINKGGIVVNQTLAQLFAQHNEHRIVTTKILTLALYNLDGWNLITHQAVNFIIYGVLVLTISFIVKKSAPELPTWILLAFTIFLLSDVSIENHFWGFQSQFHFVLLFLFLGIWFLFREKQQWLTILMGLCCAVLSIYSFSAGVVAGIIVLIAYAVFKSTRIYSGSDRKQEILQLLTAFLIIGGSLGLYFIDYTKPTSIPFTLPYQKLFWTYLLNLFSGGFGYKIDNIAPGVIIFFFTLVPIFGEIRKNGLKLSPGKWVIIVSMLAILAVLTSITMGRAGYGKGHSKASRYTEITIMLTPLSIAIWYGFLSEHKKFRTYLLIGFWIFCGFGLSRFWNFPRMYQRFAVERKEARECVENYYLNGGDGNCPTAYPHPIADRLEFTRDLPLSFIREIQKK